MASKPQNWSNVGNRTGSANSGVLRWLHTYSAWLWRPLVYSSAYLALVATAEVLLVGTLLSLPLSPAPVVGGLVTFAIYANDRLVDVDTDAASNPRRAAFVRRHGRTMYTLAAVAYGFAVAISALGGPVAFALAVFPGAVWVLYAVDWVPTGRLHFARLKEILVVNSALVAAAWSLPVVFVPLAFGDAPVTTTVGVVLVYLFLATFVNTEIANVGDVESDRQSDVATMPVVFGIKRTRWALYGVTLLAGAVVTAAAAGDYLTTTATVALSVGLLALLAVVSRLGRADDDQRLAIAAECTRLPAFAILVLPPLVG
ncbi:MULTISPECIES: UbiA family prenyltransferase [Salinibaculum]|uniref:UbiA family prenyltransferase n=1 Tax=Salinibaculum TaxID=2732368 RepID=UPI0030D28C9F